MSRHAQKESALADCYEYSITDISKKLFLAVGTVSTTEKKAIERFKQVLNDKGISVKDILQD